MGGNSNKKDADGDELVTTCDPVTIREWDPNEAAALREGGCAGSQLYPARGCTRRLLEIHLYLAPYQNAGDDENCLNGREFT